jgi:parallel beta-helix repeat protein
MFDTRKTFRTTLISLLILTMFCFVAIPLGLAVAIDPGQVANASPGSPGQDPLGASYLNSPIRINNDAELINAVASYGWTGNGTEDSPYVLLANIDAGWGSYAIYIANTDLFLNISGCSLRYTSDGGSENYSGAAIIFYNVGNASVQGGSIYNCHRGISIIGSSNINVTGMSLSSIYYDGIRVVSSNNIILDSNNIYSYYDNKIHLISTTASTVSGNSLNGGNSDGILLESSSGNVIFGNSVYSSLSAGYYGVYLRTSAGSIIENNSVGSCGNYELFIDTSIGGLISNNQLYGSNIGVRLTSSSSFLLSGNTISNAYYGVYLEYSHEIVQINNTYQDCQYVGSGMYYSHDNQFFNNTLVRCSFFLDGEFDTLTTQTIPTNNTVNGRPVYYYKNDDLGNASVPLDAGQVILGNVTNLVIQDLNLSDQTHGLIIGCSSFITVLNNTFAGDSPFGIYSIDSTYVTIQRNNISDCETGMILYSVSEFLVTSNNVSGGRDGIYLSSSNNINVLNNTISGCYNSGIQIYYSQGNNFFGNELHNCSFDINGYQSIYTDQNIATNNTVNGRPVYHYHDVDLDNASVPLDAGQVILGNVQYAQVEGLNLSDQTTGLLIGYSSSINVENNNFDNDSPYGMRLFQSIDSTINNNSYLNCLAPDRTATRSQAMNLLDVIKVWSLNHLTNAG